jgi:hypothetical protein
VVDGAAVLHLVGDQLVLLVEEEHAELFARLVRQRHPHVGQELAPGGDHRPLGDLAATDAQRGLVQQAKIERDGLADAVDAAKLGRRGRQHAGQPAKPRQERFGERFHVAARDAAREVELEQLIVGQGGQAGVRRPLAQPPTMLGIVRLGRARREEVGDAKADVGHRGIRRKRKHVRSLFQSRGRVNGARPVLFDV